MSLGPSELAAPVARGPAARWHKAVTRTLGRSKAFSAGLAIVLAIFVLAGVGPAIVPMDPAEMDFVAILQAPGPAHPFGTDDFGRDILSRVLYGSRISLLVGASVAAITLVLGLVLGLLAGFYTRLDNLLMRVMDMLMAFPAILLAIGIMAVLGAHLGNVIAALAIVYTPRSVRIVRGAVIAAKQQDYVDAARALGASDIRLMTRHIAANTIAPLVVQETFIFAYAVIAEATLSFLGVGVPAGTPSWGNIISDGRNFLEVAPWMTLFPGGILAVTVLGVNLLGDGLRDVLDPRMSRR